MPDALHPQDEVLFDGDGVRVTNRRVVVHGRAWGLEHVRGVTVLLQPLADRLLRAQAVLVGALLLGHALVQGPLAAFVREGGPGGVALGVAALLGYAALSWRILHSERTYIWLHTWFSSQLVYRGRSSTTTRALAEALRVVLQQQRRTDEARRDAA
ncbi:hypothetical protein HPC49_11075 [Pyxidicoccus fallax]|uniref:Uncharacterized protein n=1 Tax=Pyxidicoccus fallax TaxID=394095 RepID=A0A848LGE4_9BACT|nr:DUF6232 family protein [Pyxidicoccus fallax]NMO15661.1 hypothetical protein [Pyxidicoccus fallax]NPC78781.1 hypothetical protein [Pyxidicoccus fallax]